MSTRRAARSTVAGTVLLLAFATAACFLLRRWLPALASSEGVYFDRQFRFALGIVGGVFVVTQIVLAWSIARGRKGNEARTGGESGERRIEIAWAAAIVCVLALLAVTGTTALARTRAASEQNTIRLEATGMQFQWYFRYPGADAAFGETKPQLIDASIGNPLGIDPDDSYGRDDVVSAYAVVPLGHTIEITLRAQDVIHSFYAPAFRVKQDAVPGLAPHVRFTPTKLGSYEVTCAELCGLGHYRMFTRVDVVSDADYAKWMSVRARASQTAGGAQ